MEELDLVPRVDTAWSLKLKRVDDGSQCNAGWLLGNEPVITYRQFSEEACKLRHVVAGAGGNIPGDEAHEIAAEGEGRGRVDVPLEGLEHGVFHRHHVLGHEVPAAQVDEGGHFQFSRLEELAGVHGERFNPAEILSEVVENRGKFYK